MYIYKTTMNQKNYTAKMDFNINYNIKYVGLYIPDVTTVITIEKRMFSFYTACK